MTKRCSSTIAVAAMVAFVAMSAAPADTVIDGDEVNISGATLFVDFFRSPSSTNDWTDVDDDGEWGFDPDTWQVDQLAPTFTCFAWEGWWLLQYRGVGSGNGLAELVDYHLLNRLPTSIPTDLGLINRVVWANKGNKVYVGCPEQWPSGTPYAPSRIDAAVLDVPVRWFVQVDEPKGRSANWDTNPGAPGYGQCPIKSWDTNYSNKLKRLDREDPNNPGSYLSMNTNTSSPNRNTIFDTQIAWVPIAIISNRGADKECLKATELQHLFLTGRMPSGENLLAATREAGSGTRNGGMNTLGMDPSWARGDNLGSKNENQDATLLGPDHQGSNNGGSGIMELVVQRRQLAVGYTGLMGGSRAAADALAGKYEISDVMYDDRGGTVCVRPSIDNVLDNLDPDDAWQIGGPETFATRGNPAETRDPNTVVDPPAGADYINNIVASINEFAPPPCVVCDPNNPWVCNPYVTDPNDPEWCDPNKPWLIQCDPDCDPNDPNSQGSINPDSQFNMPGEFLATVYTLLGAIDGIPEMDDPSSFVPNPNLNQDLQDYTRTHTTLIVPAYGTRSVGCGKVPNRSTDPCWEWAPEDPNDPNSPLVCVDDSPYSDGSTDGNYYNYFTDMPYGPTDGSIAGDTDLNARNKISGDFNNDGYRDIDDIPAMMAAFNDRVRYATDPAYYTPWVESPGTHSTSNDPVVPEILGDFDGDGNFDELDIRYYADGLALTGRGDLDRQQAFIVVDETWCTLTGKLNFFGTVIDSPQGCYLAGDSRFDVAGRDTTPGAAPVGADGYVNQTDRDYVADNFGDWSDLDDAIHMDLSCDMDGNLVVDATDLAETDATIAGEPFTAEIFGDDCCINLQDLGRLLATYSKCPGDPGYDAGADLYDDGTGCINLQDLGVLLAQYRNGCCP